MEFSEVSKNCKKEWYIIRIPFFIIFAVITVIIAFIETESGNSGELAGKIIGLCLLGFLDIWMFIYAFIFPSMQYDRYKYKISDERIERKSGVIFLRHQIVPFVRMQHIVIYRGILDRIFNMSTVSVFTAGTLVRLRNLGVEQAEEVTNQLNAILKQKETSGEVAND